MKSVLIVLALSFSIPALADGQIEITSAGVVKSAHIVSAKLGEVVVASREDGNCDMVSADGRITGCDTVVRTAEKVRVQVEYDSPVGANPTAEASAENAASGPVFVNFDFDPAQIEAGRMERIKGLKDARQLFRLSALVKNETITVVDYDNSFFCAADTPLNCQDKIVYKTVVAPVTTLAVSLK